MNKYTYAPPCSKEQLLAMYVEQTMTQVEIAKALGCSRKVVETAMRYFNIPRRIAAKRDQRGAKNARWKGSEAGYAALHLRVATLRGKPKFCVHCQTTSAKHFDWANVTGNYGDVNDYIRLCRSCHWRMDERVSNLRQNA
jgi:hypothetical protein